VVSVEEKTIIVCVVEKGLKLKVFEFLVSFEEKKLIEVSFHINGFVVVVVVVVVDLYCELTDGVIVTNGLSD
jgi:hypothetical protein